MIGADDLDAAKKSMKSLFGDSAEHLNSCVEVAPVVHPALVPVLTTLFKFGFDQSQDRKLRELQAIKKAGQKTYSSQALVSAKKIRDLTCVVMVRYREVPGDATANELGLLMIARVKHYPVGTPREALTVQPVLVLAKNSVAKTSANAPTINASLVVAMQAIGRNNETGLPQLVPIGASVSTVSKIALGEVGSPRCVAPETCTEGGLLPHLESDDFVSFSVSITETGNLGIDFDAREAEIKAIKEAFGPALKDSLKEVLGDD